MTLKIFPLLGRGVVFYTFGANKNLFVFIICVNTFLLNSYNYHNTNNYYRPAVYQRGANVQFTSKISSKSLDFSFDDFFVKLRGYGRNETWAKEVIRTADNAVNLINMKLPAESVLINIADGVKRANGYTLDLNKRSLTGILRAQRPGWDYRQDLLSMDLITRYNGLGVSRYGFYSKRLDEVYTHPLENPYYDFELTQVKHKDSRKYLHHASSIYVNRVLDMVNRKYYALISEYPDMKVKSSQLDDFNFAVAEIKWILAHSTPWVRGSDAISNVFVKSLYKAFGIKSYPLKQNVSLDLEAYCTNLADYKKNFSNYFEHPPEVV